MTFQGALTAADRGVLGEWWQQAQRHPQLLPRGLVEVQSRLVRAVGRGNLPDAGEAFAKLMWFPRSKDRLRYFFRPLPAEHEGAMLHHCHRAGITVPEVLFVGAQRLVRSPRTSMLVTAGLPLAEGTQLPAPQSIAVLVGQLLAAGVFHPDLHAENFLSLVDGRLAVIDMQSARLSAGGVSAARRRAMLSRLLEAPEPWCATEADQAAASAMATAIERAGLCDAAELGAIREFSSARSRRALVSRVQRCFRESTQFRVRKEVSGTLFSRRDADLDAAPGEWVEGGAELVRYWVGDRCREILESSPPLLGALYRFRWRRGRCRVYVPHGGYAALSAAVPGLQEAHERYRELTQGAG